MNMCFPGQTNAISITVDMHERDHLDIIKSVFGLVEAYGKRFISLLSIVRLCSRKRCGRFGLCIDMEEWGPL